MASIESPYYPYPPRPGTHTEVGSADTLRDGEVLHDHNREAVIQFENDLYDLQLAAVDFPTAEAYRQKREAEGIAIEPLETIWRKKVNSFSLGIDYFLTPEGREAWRAATGDELSVATPETCAQVVSSQDIHMFSSTVLDKLEADSIGYIEKDLTKKFIENDFQGDTLPSPNIISVYKNPEVLVEKASGYRALKEYIINVKADVLASASPQDPEIDGKLLIIDLYLKRINSLLADEYIDAYKVLKQYQLSDATIHTDIVADLENILPAFKNTDDSLRNAQVLQRLDRYKNGVSQDADGHYTWKSPEADTLAAQATHANSTEVERSLYNDIDPELLATTEIDGETQGEWIKSVLSDYGLLSEHEDWTSERTGPAADGLWQVIVNDRFKSLAVNTKQRVVKIPLKQTPINKAVPVSNHEISHVLQYENRHAISELAILQDIGFDNALEQTEAGGLWQEEIAREALTGKTSDRIPGIGYFKALEIKERGGTYGEIVQAYFESLREHSDINQESAAAQAVNRARRIFRAGGFEYAQDTPLLTNTQPLNYLEQKLIYEGLDEEKRRFLLVGGVTVRNLVRLSQAGLVDTQKISTPEKMPWELLYPRVRELVDQQETTKGKNG
jgi:hypothetical protein